MFCPRVHSRGERGLGKQKNITAFGPRSLQESQETKNHHDFVPRVPIQGVKEPREAKNHHDFLPKVPIQGLMGARKAKKRDFLPKDLIK